MKIKYVTSSSSSILAAICNTVFPLSSAAFISVGITNSCFASAIRFCIMSCWGVSFDSGLDDAQPENIISPAKAIISKYDFFLFIFPL